MAEGAREEEFEQHEFAPEELVPPARSTLELPLAADELEEIEEAVHPEHHGHEPQQAQQKK